MKLIISSGSSGSGGSSRDKIQQVHGMGDMVLQVIYMYVCMCLFEFSDICTSFFSTSR